MMKDLLLAGLGGGIGTISRYLIQKAFSHFYWHHFPLSTFLINIAGCFIIGLFYALAQKTSLFSPSTIFFVITGLCGGFTTFSSFALENMMLLRSGHWLAFISYSLLSLGLGLAAVFAGAALIK